MTMDRRRRAVLAALVTLTLVPTLVSRAALAIAGDEDFSVELAAATKRATGETYLLRYRFAKGEMIRWKVRHLGTTEATVRGATQTSKMRAISTKQWEVTDVDSQGNATFVYTVTDVDMWQKISGRPEVRYNSETDKSPPSEYVQVAKSVGVPIATVSVTPSGKVLQRNKAPTQTHSGLGNIIMPLPVEPVRIGASWHVSNEIRVRSDKTGRAERVKTRIVYTLDEVKTGLATINVRTELVTPVDDPAIKSQLVQQLTNGEIEFDLDAGRIYSQQIDWDETVVGFSGDNSVMKYLAHFTEELVGGDVTAGRSTGGKVR